MARNEEALFYKVAGVVEAECSDPVKHSVLHAEVHFCYPTFAKIKIKIPKSVIWRGADVSVHLKPDSSQAVTFDSNKVSLCSILVVFLLGYFRLL